MPFFEHITKLQIFRKQDVKTDRERVFTNEDINYTDMNLQLYLKRSHGTPSKN